MNEILQQKAKTKVFEEEKLEYIHIKNPTYVFPPYDLVPLAPKLKALSDISAIVMDMDGTTTTTEDLCLHSLEYMIRAMSGTATKKQWAGFVEEDYPNVIGNSTTKHVEYLIKKYENIFKIDSIAVSYALALQWTVRFSEDERRKEELLFNFNSLQCDLNENDLYSKSHEMISEKISKKIDLSFFNQIVRIGIDIYYQRYHFILNEISSGNSKKVAYDLFGDPSKNIIKPMAGAAFMLCLVKGLLGSNAESVLKSLIKEENLQFEIISTHQLNNLSKYFAEHPVKLAVVTSSIKYEADIVLYEVFKLIIDQIKNFPITNENKSEILNHFADYKNFYDAIVTASDSSEIRLKPHRDLYNIALHKLNIGTEKLNEVIGFEDSESGTVAIRAAGIGLCVAVPFAETSDHNLQAASYICKGGLFEAIIKYNLFLKDK